MEVGRRQVGGENCSTLQGTQLKTTLELRITHTLQTHLRTYIHKKQVHQSSYMLALGDITSPVHTCTA